MIRDSGLLAGTGLKALYGTSKVLQLRPQLTQFWSLLSEGYVVARTRALGNALFLPFAWTPLSSRDEACTSKIRVSMRLHAALCSIVPRAWHTFPCISIKRNTSWTLHKGAIHLSRPDRIMTRLVLTWTCTIIRSSCAQEGNLWSLPH